MAKLTFEKKFAFDVWDNKKIQAALKFAEGYKKFVSECKTEREVVKFVEKEVSVNGYKKLETFAPANFKSTLKKKFYNVNREKSIVLARLGEKSLREGLRILIAHIDSPRLDLKIQPFYEEEHLAFLKTHYYGGIKKYQWPALPLAMHGVIAKENGKKVEINIGEKAEEPVLMITDLLPHLGDKQLQKRLSEAITGEDLNLVIGSMADKKEKGERVKKNLLKILNKKYGVSEEDFVSADLEIVPAGFARDLGFDSSLIAAYGQDDRINAYAGLRAIFDAKKSEYATVLVLVDREEVGSEGATGATSNFVIDFISELLYLECGEHNENYLRDTLSLSKAISMDVTVGFDPDYTEVVDKRNTARIGAGVVIEKHTGHRGKMDTNEATAEYVAYIRSILNKNKIVWQTGELGKVDAGGGGTIALFFARYNVDVIDCGPALLSMHAPYEISSKADLYCTYLAGKAFLGEK